MPATVLTQIKPKGARAQTKLLLGTTKYPDVE